MNLGNALLVAIIGMAALVTGGWVWRRFFSADARWERRRRRSNTRVSSTAKRPMVRFSVQVRKQRG